MAQSTKMRAQAKKLEGRPVCVTLYNGETYVGRISEVNASGVVLTAAEALRPASPEKRRGSSGANKTAKHVEVVRRRSSRARGCSGSSVRPNSRRAQSRRPDAKVSSLFPLMSSLFGGLGGLGGAAGGAGGLGGLLGGGMRFFGMIQRFVPVVQMGYGMIKSIRPFVGAVQGLMAPSPSASSEGDPLPGDKR